MLAELDTRGITFLTLRMRSPALVRHIDSQPASEWRTVWLDRDGHYTKPKVVGVGVGSFEEFARLEAAPGADESDEVGCVHGAPARLGALDELERHHEPGRA